MLSLSTPAAYDILSQIYIDWKSAKTEVTRRSNTFDSERRFRIELNWINRDDSNSNRIPKLRRATEFISETRIISDWWSDCDWTSRDVKRRL